MLAAQAGSAILRSFLIILVCWVTVSFVSFGLFAPTNATVVATLLVCALSVSAAIFLILELDQPFPGDHSAAGCAAARSPADARPMNDGCLEGPGETPPGERAPEKASKPAVVPRRVFSW